MTPSRDGQTGFTLLEVLVVLVVLGLLMVLMSQATRFGTAAVTRGARVAETTEAVDATERVLRQLIAAAQPGERRAASFRADARTLAFVARLPPTLADAPGIAPAVDAVVSLRLDDASRLSLVLTPRFADLNAATPLPASRLLDHVARFAVAFHDASGWHAAWTAGALPDLVRLSIGFSDGRHWPDIVVAPRTGPSAA